MEQIELIDEASETLRDIMSMVDGLMSIIDIARKADVKATEIVHRIIHTDGVYGLLPDELKEAIRDWASVSIALDKEVERQRHNAQRFEDEIQEMVDEREVMLEMAISELEEE
jgi:hypothetical protein